MSGPSDCKQQSCSGRGVRVLVVSPTYPGPGRPHDAPFIHRRAKQLVDSGLNVEVLTRRHITLGTYLSSWGRVKEFYTKRRRFSYEWEGIHVEGVRMHMGLPLNYSRHAVRRSEQMLRPVVMEIRERFPFDLVQLAGWGDMALAVARIAKREGIPYVASAIGGYENRYHDKPKSIPYGIMRELYAGAELVVCVSEDLNRKVQTLTGGQVPTLTFYSGVDTDRYRPRPDLREPARRKLGFDPADVVVATVCRLVKEKGVFELVDAFARVRKRIPEARLMLVGPTRGGSLQRRLRKLRLKREVVLVGPVSPLEIPELLSAADVFAFPSWMEGLPNAVLEGCSCGLAVVATAVGGIPELIEDGRSGLLVPSRDTEKLSEALERLCGDAGLRARLGAGAREVVMRRFNYAENGKQLATILMELARGDHERRRGSMVAEKAE